METAVRLREDFDATQPRALAKQSEEAEQTRRLLALAVIYDAGSSISAAALGGVGLQTVRDWVLDRKRLAVHARQLVAWFASNDDIVDHCCDA